MTREGTDITYKSTLSSNTNLNRVRSVSSQACDACRIRKTKCDTSRSQPPSTAASLQQLDGPSSSDIEAVQPCRRCARLGLACIFLLPSGVRGPRRKNQQSTTSQSSSVPTVFSSQDPVFSGSQFPESAALTSTARDDVTSPMSHVSEQLSSSISGMSGSPTRSHQWTHSPQSLHVQRSPMVPAYPTDELCNRPMLIRILHDYLEYLYPMLPVVHRPSFRRDLEQNRDLYDKEFLGLIIGLCAVTVGTMPSRFEEYRLSDTPITFETRTDMVNYCYQKLMGLRDHGYFDEISLQKWAASYLIAISSFQVGQWNRARMMEVEHSQLARLLNLHHISRYEGLNCIEIQLRKKAFWLMFYHYIHSQLQNLRKERLAYLDETILSNVNLEELMPLEVDDEMILEDIILPQPARDISLVTAFNVHSRVFWAALTSTHPRHSPKYEPQYCSCVRSADPALQITHLNGRLHDLKFMLDGIPSQLRQWNTAEDDDSWLGNSSAESRRIIKCQFASLRANLHVTHIWLQSMIRDQISALMSNISTGASSNLPTLDPKYAWIEREDICRQLLYILHGIPEINLEANGHHLTCKVRDVAVTLLACPFDASDEVAIRAHKYLVEFTNKLTRLDKSETMNTMSLQSWVDTDRRG